MPSGVLAVASDSVRPRTWFKRLIVRPSWLSIGDMKKEPMISKSVAAAVIVTAVLFGHGVSANAAEVSPSFILNSNGPRDKG